LAGYCQAFAAWAECERFLAENGNVIVLRNDKGEIRWIQEAPQARLALKHLEKVRQFAAELGLSPSARTRIHAQPDEKQSPTEAFLYGPQKRA
jgi:P27 family predicted phage terminase small subunit